MTNRLDVGAVIRRVFDIYVDQYPVLLPASAVVFVITGIVSALLVAAAPGLALIALLLSLIAGTLFTGMVVELVSDIQDGRRDHSAGELLRAATPVLGVIFVLFFLVLVVSAGIEIGADSAGTGAGIVARVIVGILTAPISALAAAVLYFDLRAASGKRVAADSPVAGSPPPIS